VLPHRNQQASSSVLKLDEIVDRVADLVAATHLAQA
jgi:hypothetical protein